MVVSCCGVSSFLSPGVAPRVSTAAEGTHHAPRGRSRGCCCSRSKDRAMAGESKIRGFGVSLSKLSTGVFSLDLRTRAANRDAPPRDGETAATDGLRLSGDVGNDYQRVLGDVQEEGETSPGSLEDPMPTAHALALGVWATAVGVFLLTNYYWATSPFPSPLGAVDVRTWALVHAIAGMLFAGGIFTTAFVEWLVITSASQPVKDFWFNTATKAEAAMVLPGLTGSLVSGVGQAWIMYQCPLQYAPLHIRLPIHVLVLFGIWWAATDLTTRNAARDESIQSRRLASNLVSCLLVLVLYVIMVLKPGN